jgi:hypothetical protein
MGSVPRSATLCRLPGTGPGRRDDRRPAWIGHAFARKHEGDRNPPAVELHRAGGRRGDARNVRPCHRREQRHRSFQEVLRRRAGHVRESARHRHAPRPSSGDRDQRREHRAAPATCRPWRSSATLAWCRTAPRSTPTSTSGSTGPGRSARPGTSARSNGHKRCPGVSEMRARFDAAQKARLPPEAWNPSLRSSFPQTRSNARMPAVLPAPRHWLIPGLRGQVRRVGSAPGVGVGHGPRGSSASGSPACKSKRRGFPSARNSATVCRDSAEFPQATRWTFSCLQWLWPRGPDAGGCGSRRGCRRDGHPAGRTLARGVPRDVRNPGADDVVGRPSMRTSTSGATAPPKRSRRCTSSRQLRS